MSINNTKPLATQSPSKQEAYFADKVCFVKMISAYKSPGPRKHLLLRDSELWSWQKTDFHYTVISV